MNGKKYRLMNVKVCLDILLSQWNERGINYLILRGWDGRFLSGSDIDILLDDGSWSEAVSILRKTNFKEEKRKWYFFDFLAREVYYNNLEAGIKFHLSNKILFGKPIRRIRFPIENIVLSRRLFSPDIKGFVVSVDLREIIDLPRLMIDKPYLIKDRSFNHVKFGKYQLFFNGDLSGSIQNIYNLFTKYREEDTPNSEIVIKKTIFLLKSVKGSEYLARSLQTKFSRFLYFLFGLK